MKPANRAAGAQLSENLNPSQASPVREEGALPRLLHLAPIPQGAGILGDGKFGATAGAVSVAFGEISVL
jgi:hypothetical protein